MSESPIMVFMFAGIMVSLGVIAVTCCMMTVEMRRVLRRMGSVLPHCDQAVLEAHQTLKEARRFFMHTNQATHHVESVVHKASSAAAELLDAFMGVKKRAQAFLVERLGNGAGAEPGRHNRRHNHHRRVGE